MLWLKNGKVIDLADGSAAQKSAPQMDKLWARKDVRGTPILTINDIDRNDSGEYACRVRNAFGVAQSGTTARLEVACKCSVRFLCYVNLFVLQLYRPSGSQTGHNRAQVATHCGGFQSADCQASVHHHYGQSESIVAGPVVPERSTLLDHDQFETIGAGA